MKWMALLSLMSVFLTHALHADDVKDLAAQLAEQFRADKADRAASRANPKDYYERKLASCLFEQDLDNALADKKHPIDLKDCSANILEALSRGDLDETGMREVIDSLSAKRKKLGTENAASIERQRELQRMARDLVAYGNQRLN
jgi:hypothetical protein